MLIIYYWYHIINIILDIISIFTIIKYLLLVIRYFYIFTKEENCARFQIN